MKRTHRLSTLVILLARLRSSCHANSMATLEGWQVCDQFLAPSSIPGAGWGVFAARDFSKNEVVEVAPLYLPLNHDMPVLKHSVLEGYVYDANVVVGNVMFYNHHPEPNLHFQFYGMEPSSLQPTAAMGLGFVASRDIQAGEELFSTYGHEDGGKTWFETRQLSLSEVPHWASRKNGTDLIEAAQRYCSKIHAGVGLPTWQERIIPAVHDEEVTNWFLNATIRLGPFDAGFGSAVARVNVSAGDILESAPAMALLKHLVDGTSIAPLVLPPWDQLTKSQQESLESLRASGDLRVRYQSEETDWLSVDQEWQDFDEISIFLVAGRIALVQRVGGGVDQVNDEANCRLEIQSPESCLLADNMCSVPTGMGIVLHLIATKDIKAGETLKLNLPASGTPEEVAALCDLLETTGQPLPQEPGKSCRMTAEARMEQ